MIMRTPYGVSSASYRSPPMSAAALAETYRPAMASWPTCGPIGLQHGLLGDRGQPDQFGVALVLALPDHADRDRAAVAAAMPISRIQAMPSKPSVAHSDRCRR